MDNLKAAVDSIITLIEGDAVVIIVW